MQAALAQSARESGTSLSFNAQATNVAAVTNASPASCQRKFGHWCLDGTSLDKADIAGIIVGGCIFIILVAGLVGFLAYRTVKRRRALAP